MSYTIHTYAGWLFYFVTAWHVVFPAGMCWLAPWQVAGSLICCAAVTWLVWDHEEEDSQ